MQGNKKTIAAAAVAVAIIATAGFLAGRLTMHPSRDAGPGTTDSSAEAVDRKIAYWRAPMDPTEIYDAPGKSKMGMDLVPVYEAAGGDQGVLPQTGPETNMIRIDPAISQKLGVRTAPVQRRDFSRTIRTVGKVDYDEDALHVASTRISGWIENLYVDFVGQEVRKGDPLLDIYSPALVSTQREYLLAFANNERAKESSIVSVRDDAARLLASTRQRLEYWMVSPSVIEALESTGQVQKTVTLQAPSSGVVIRKEAIEGEHVAQGSDLFEIADLSSVWVHASVYDDELPWIEEGQTAVMDLSYLPGREFRGTVSYVYPYLRDKARDAHARIIFRNPERELKPGMYVNIRLEGTAVRNALVIPLESVIRSGARSIAFVKHPGGHYEPREIQTGEEGGENNSFVRVLSGLNEGEEVVTSAQFMLDSESRLQEAIQKLLESRRMENQTPTRPEPAMENMDGGMPPPAMDTTGTQAHQH